MTPALLFLNSRRRACCAAMAIVIVGLVSVPAPAHAVGSTGTDPTDAPAGPQGKTDLRTVAWNVGANTTTQTIAVDASTFGAGERAALGVHVLVDTDRDGIADAETLATRNVNGTSVDVVLRTLDRTLSTADCQDLASNGTGPSTTRAPTVANGRETFTFTFANSAMPGGLTHFRWAAFGQSPGATASSGPWDYLPNATNPDAGAPNPGDRRCDVNKSGVILRMSAGIDVDTSNAAPTATVSGARCSSSNPRAATINVKLADQDLDPVTLALVSNSNPTLVPNPNVVLGGSGYNRTVTVTSATNKSGRTTLTFNVSDGKVVTKFVATVIVGTANTETLTGTAGTDVIFGFAGTNTLSGNGGNDLLCGGSSTDNLNGGAGNDILTGGAGADKFSGGPGTDVVTDYNAGAGDTKDATIP